MSHALGGDPDGYDPEGVVGWGTSRLRGRVRALLNSLYNQPDTAAVNVQFERVLDTLEHKLPAVAQHLQAACADILAFTSFPKKI